MVSSILRDGKTLGTHRTDFYYVGSNTRERCAYSRGTIQDAMNSITPLARKLLDSGHVKIDGKWVKTVGGPGYTGETGEATETENDHG
jgi:hypothetical protein